MISRRYTKIKSVDDLPSTIEKQGIIIPGTSDKEGLTLDSVGVGYRDRRCHLVCPWHHIKKAFVTDRLQLQISSPKPGVGYLVHRAKITVDDETPPLAITNREDLIIFDSIFALPLEALAAAINYYRNQIVSKKEAQLTHGFFVGQKSSITGHNDKTHTLFLLPEAPPHYPAFCPITGDDCDTVAFLPSKNSADAIPWLVSSSGAANLQKSKLWRTGSVICSLLLYLMLGLYFHLTKMDAGMTFPWQQALAGTGLFTPLPIIWWLTQNKVQIRRRGGIRISFADKEYYEAFLDLNASL